MKRLPAPAGRGVATMADAKNHGESAARARDEQDLAGDLESGGPQRHAISPAGAPEHARVVQALRDVRHLLPPEGVAIVDQALTGVRSGAETALFEPGVESGGTLPLN